MKLLRIYCKQSFKCLDVRFVKGKTYPIIDMETDGVRKITYMLVLNNGNEFPLRDEANDYLKNFSIQKA